MLKGQIVCSVAGRDKGSFLMVVGEHEKGVLVCDGKARPIERPKLKNKKHVKITNCVIEQERVTGNKALRRLLNETAKGLPKEEKLNV